MLPSIAGSDADSPEKRFNPRQWCLGLYDLGVVPAAAGENPLHIFRIGDGVFERGPKFSAPHIAARPGY